MKLKFRDLKGRENFETDKYEIVSITTSRGIRYQAIATSPKGNKCFRFIKKP